MLSRQVYDNPSVTCTYSKPTAKFSKAVLEAVSDGTDLPRNEFDMVEKRV